jgi:hypothetical protein
MRLKFRQAAALAGTGLADVLRQPVVLLLTVSGLGFVGLLPHLILLRLGDPARLVRDGGLAVHLALGVIVACLAAASTLTRDLRGGTAATALCKPIGRDLYFLARFAGVALAMLLFSALFLPATLLSARAVAAPYQVDGRAAWPLLLAPAAAFMLAGAAHAFANRPFAATAFPLLLAAMWAALGYGALVGPDGEWVPAGSLLPWAVMSASLLVAALLLVIAALAYALSVRLAPAFNLSVCAAVMFLGLVSDHAFGRRAAESAGAALAYAVIPNFQAFWMPDAIARGGIPAGYVLGACAYALLYCLVFLIAGALLFRRVEIP